MTWGISSIAGLSRTTREASSDGGLDEVVEAFRTRRLDHVEFPYLYLDATYLNVRNTVAQPASMATVVATGITADGNREVLGCDVGDSKSEAFWQQFLGSLRDRGLGGMRLVISDAHRGPAADRWTLADLHDEWQATDRRYLSEDSMSLLYPERDAIPTAELTTGNQHRRSTRQPTT